MTSRPPLAQAGPEIVGHRGPSLRAYTANMFVLLGTDLQRRRRPIVTESLIILMMVAYLAVLAIGIIDRALAEQIIDGMALSSRDFQWWQLISYQFAHDSPLLPGNEHPIWRLLHLALNAMCLWVFGGAVEDRMQRPSFACFALLGGVMAGLAHMLTTPAPVIGASGMVGGLAGAFLVLAPRCKVRILVIFILIRIWSVPALLVIGFWVALDLAGWAGLRDSQVAYAAHLAGYLWGGLTALVLLATSIIQRSDADLIYVLKQWRRRRAWRETVTSKPTSAQQADRRRSPQPPFLAEVRSAMRRGESDQACDLWISENQQHPEAVLPAQDQLQLANQLQASGKRHDAAQAYQRYLKHYGDSAQAAEVKLLLGLLLTRWLDQQSEAIPLLEQAMQECHDPKRQDLARMLLQEAAP